MTSRRIGGLPSLLGLVFIAGYGLFRGVNSSSYLSAMASVDAAFLFVPDIGFNVAVALCVIATCVVVIFAGAKGRLPAFSIPYRAPIALLLFYYLLVVSGALSALSPVAVMALSSVSFALFSVALSLAWIELFVMEKPSAIITQIAAGMVLSTVCSWFLKSLPPATQALVSCGCLLLVGGALFYLRRMLPLVLAEDAVYSDSAPATPLRIRGALGELSDAFIAFFVLEAAVGLVNSYMLAGEMVFVGADSVANIAMAVAVVLFWVCVVVAQRIPKASTVFRVVAPMIAAMLVFVPFVSDAYSRVFTVTFLASYDFMALLLTYLVAVVCRERRVSSYVIMAIALGGARLCLLVALVTGTAAGSFQGGFFEEGTSMRFLMIVVAVIYALSLVLVFFSRDRRRRRRVQDVDGLASCEDCEREKEAQDGGGSFSEQAFCAPEELSGEQALGEVCAQLSCEYGLTERESEVLEYLARGRSCSHIAETLVVSINTIRGHVRNIYAKLDVHKRQELIDLVEARQSLRALK
ncbi:MAG: helix-turn-helix transcriptional regulator [Raoultibacter sp.]